MNLDVMALARELGVEVTDFVNYAYGEDVAVFREEDLMAFAVRVTAIDRERCAREATPENK